MVKRTIPKSVLQEMARQKKEHPWMTQTQLRRVAMDHQRTGGEGMAPKVILERTIAIPTPVKKKRRPVEQPPWYVTVGSQFF